MADIETLEDVVVNEDPVAQMSVVPLATRMRMASEDDQLQRPKYYHMDDALRMSYDDIMSKQTDTQLVFKRGAEAKSTSETGEIVRGTVENYIVNALNKPEKAVLAIGNIMTAAGSTVGKDWANWANESINDFVENNYASQRAGDAETWAAKITGGVLSGLEYMGLGMVSSPLASVSMGVDILGDATKNDIDRYIAETGDKSLANYRADWRDVGINILNTGVQLYIEDHLGFGRILKAKSHGASEFLTGFAQEFFQGEIGDIAEAAKGNKRWREVYTNILNNVKDGIVGSFLQGSLGLAAHHHYASVAENQMKDFFMETGMDEKAAQQKAHTLRLKLENEVAPLVVKQDKEIYDLVMQKGAVWGQIYDSVYSGMRLVDSVMTEEELRNKATEVADNVATQVIESVVKNGTDLSETMIGFNPVDRSIYVNDKKTLDIKQALEEVKALDEKPMTKEEVKQVIKEEKKVEEEKKAEQEKPVQAIKPDALFNKTKQKSPQFKQLQLNLEDGTIKLTRTENIRYQNLLRDKHNGKPTTNAQMDMFAQKMLNKYVPEKISGNNFRYTDIGNEHQLELLDNKGNVISVMTINKATNGVTGIETISKENYGKGYATTLLQEAERRFGELTAKPELTQKAQDFWQKNGYTKPDGTGKFKKEQPAKPNKYDIGAKKASKMSETLKQNAPAELAEEMAQEMDGEYNQRMTKDAVTDAVNFALSSEENMQTAIDAVMNMKEVDGIRPYEMYAGLMIIATKYNHPLLFEQLRNSPIHQGLARQAGQDISALQFTTESGMINVMKVIDSLDQNIMTKENKETVEKNVKELRNVLNEIDYLDPETIEAIESLEC